MPAVAVIGGGVVGAAVAYMLARRDVRSVLLEAEEELAGAASGTNSGILHTGFDSKPGELETELILRSAELRDAVIEELGLRVIRCGALLRPHTDEEADRVRTIAAGAETNGVEVSLSEEGTLEVPGESITDPVQFTLALAGAAAHGGARVRLSARVTAIRRRAEGLLLELADGEEIECCVAVNCAGLFADEIARLVDDDSFEVYPRKGEFFVFDPPGGPLLEQILLPVPDERTKGVLVFPTVDGSLIAGPTAHDQEDKRDWSVREGAWSEVEAKAFAMFPALAATAPGVAYAGLRPAGRAGVNYVIAPAATCPELINVAAIRSTGLTAALGIGERVTALAGERGVELGPDRPLERGPWPQLEVLPWWRRAALRSARYA